MVDDACHVPHCAVIIIDCHSEGWAVGVLISWHGITGGDIGENIQNDLAVVLHQLN